MKELKNIDPGSLYRFLETYFLPNAILEIQLAKHAKGFAKYTVPLNYYIINKKISEFLVCLYL